MKTKQNKNLLITGAILAVCLIMVWLAGSIQGGQKSYELKPEITLPEYRTDTARAIDAYERVMDRFMRLTERNLTGINTDVKDIAKKLVLIDCRLMEISTRMARIEKTLGIEHSEKLAEQPSKTETHNSTDKPDLKGRKCRTR